MFVTSAVGLGFFVVFMVGTGVTFLIVNQIVIIKRCNPKHYQNTSKLYDSDYQIKISFIGGGFTVGLLILSLFFIPRGWVIMIWSVLTGLGILFGISTFFINRPASRVQTRAEYRPLASTGVPPPAQKNPYQNLLAKVRYDKSVADRLIEYERKFMPNASLDELCRRAIERLNRDNR